MAEEAYLRVVFAGWSVDLLKLAQRKAEGHSQHTAGWMKCGVKEALLKSDRC